MITVSCELTKGDFLAFACHYYAESPTVRRQLRTGQIMNSLASGSVVFLIVGTTNGFAAGLVMFFLTGAALAAMFPKYYRSRICKTAEKMYAESSYQKAFGKYTLVFTDQGIASSNPTGESKIVWNAVDHVSVTHDYLFIFLAGPQGFIIPRAQVQEFSFAEVKTYVEARIPTKPPASV
jgi:hypothetical protein